MPRHWSNKDTNQATFANKAKLEKLKYELLNGSVQNKRKNYNKSYTKPYSKVEDNQKRR